MISLIVLVKEMIFFRETEGMIISLEQMAIILQFLMARKNNIKLQSLDTTNIKSEIKLKAEMELTSLKT